MSSSKDLTTREYAKKMGISASTVAKWLRSGKLKGQKQNGKWIIPADSSVSEIASSPDTPENTLQKRERADQFYSVEKFSDITYLTEFGVEKWLKEGRLKGVRDNSGQWQVSAESLQLHHMQHLLRN
jgi:excisionase family DNA binding protein